MDIEILDGGLQTTIQDLGRTGYQAQGMVVSGAMDPYSFQIANLLVGNHPNEPALETTLFGLTLQVHRELIVAVTGADLGLEIDGQPAPLWETIPLRKGSIIRFTGRTKGVRAYLAFQGGLALEPIFESCATYLMGRIGGYQGRALQKGDHLNVKRHSSSYARFFHRKLPPEYIPRYPKQKHLRVILGINQDAFTEEGIHTFLTTAYKITPRYNRMGMRLQGAKIAHRTKADIISTTVTFGTVQVPANGQPIVLLADRQTTGGYTQIANVITADLPLLGQSLAGESLAFRTISLKQAQRLAIEQNRFLKQLQAHQWH